MSFDVNNDSNWQSVKNTLFSQPGNVPVVLPHGQGIHNPGERSHGLDTSQVHDYLLYWLEYACQQASQGGVSLNSTFVTNATNIAKESLSGKRPYVWNPDGDANFTSLRQRLSFLKGSDVDQFLLLCVRHLCSLATAGGSTLGAGVIQSMLDAAKSALVGKRSF